MLCRLPDSALDRLSILPAKLVSVPSDTHTLCGNRARNSLIRPDVSVAIHVSLEIHWLSLSLRAENPGREEGVEIGLSPHTTRYKLRTSLRNLHQPFTERLEMLNQLQLDFQAEPPVRAVRIINVASTCADPITVTVTVALRLTGLGRTKLYELIAAGQVETVKVGRRRLVHLQSLERLVTVGAT
jgi:excisionase family DNA binding protein